MDKYEKGVVLGHGTFGSVYKAVHKEVGSGPARLLPALHCLGGQRASPAAAPHGRLAPLPTAFSV
jgi:hypothetical protein